MGDQHDAQQPDEPVGARFAIRDDIPGDQLIMPVNTPTETVMAVRTGHISPELVDALNVHLEYMTKLGLWRRMN